MHVLKISLMNMCHVLIYTSLTNYRIVFSLEELDSTSHSHDYFFKSLKSKYDSNFRAELLSTDFYQYFDYEKTKELVSLLKMKLE